MSERTMWARLKDDLSDPGLLPMERFEDKLAKGRPDILWQDPLTPGRAGWLESKWVAAGPAPYRPLRARGKRNVSRPPAPRGKAIGIRADQVLFLRRWVRRRGLAHILVGVGRPLVRWGLITPEDTDRWGQLVRGPEAWHLIEWLDHGHLSLPARLAP